MQLDAYLARAECNDIVVPSACLEHTPLIPPDVDERFSDPVPVIRKNALRLHMLPGTPLSLLETRDRPRAIAELEFDPLTVPTRRLR